MVPRGTYTLPVIRALADPAAGDELRSLLGDAISSGAPPPGPRPRPAPAAGPAELVRSTTGVDESRDTARMWADKAQAALTSPPDTPATSVLRLATNRLTDTSVPARS